MGTVPSTNTRELPAVEVSLRARASGSRSAFARRLAVVLVLTAILCVSWGASGLAKGIEARRSTGDDDLVVRKLAAAAPGTEGFELLAMNMWQLVQSLGQVVSRGWG